MRTAVLIVALGFLALAGFGAPPEGALPARITRWLDGDTCDLRFTGPVPEGVAPNERVRLLGIDAPEVGEPLAEEATRLFRTLTLGKPVYVELNPRELRDTHRRLLGYIWVEGDEGWVMVNEALLRGGLARLLVFHPERERYYCRFLRAVALAQREGRGLWAEAALSRPLEEIEGDPGRYAAQAVTVVFAVSRVSLEPQGWVLWASGSRYGFRALLQPGLCPEFWGEDPPALLDLAGRVVRVTGELRWDSLRGGPRVLVLFPEQLELWEVP